MKFPGLLCFLCLFAGSLFAEDPKPATIVTLSGAKYEKAVVTGQAPDGISVTHSAGVAKIPFTDLPAEIQKQYGYDPAKATAYQKAVADAQRARAEAERARLAAKKHAEQVEWTRKQQENFDEQNFIREIDEALRNGWRPTYDPLTRRTYYNEAEAYQARRDALKFIGSQRGYP